MAPGPRRCELTFYSVSGNEDILYDSPNLYRSVDDAIDQTTINVMTEKSKKYEEKLVETETLDDLLAEANPTIMKVNALAADFEILKGSKKIIEKNKPIIIIEHGVKPENIVDIMFFLSRLRSDYQFYLRQKNIFGDSKTIMYAV